MLVGRRHHSCPHQQKRVDGQLQHVSELAMSQWTVTCQPPQQHVVCMLYCCFLANCNLPSNGLSRDAFLTKRNSESRFKSDGYN